MTRLPLFNTFTIRLPETSTEGEIEDHIKMYIDDMDRLGSDCPKFPLRAEHLKDTLVKYIPEDDAYIETSRMRCHSDYSTRDGRLYEDAYCDFHQRQEFDHAPTIVRRQPTGAQVAQRREIGKKIIKYATCVPIFGWVVLNSIAQKGHLGNDLVWQLSEGKVRDFGEDEVNQANKNLLWSIGITSVILVLVLAALLAVELK